MLMSSLSCSCEYVSVLQGQYRWTDGSLMDYEHWDRTNTIYPEAASADEDCVYAWGNACGANRINRMSKWRDGSCFRTTAAGQGGFICERRTVCY